MKTFNIVALAILGAQLASAGWMGTASCETGRGQWVSSSQGCATAFWTEYTVWAYDVESGEGTYVQYPVLIQEEMSFRTSGFSTLSVHQRNQPVEIFWPDSFEQLEDPNFSLLDAFFFQDINVYGPGLPGDYWVDVEWQTEGHPGFLSSANVEGHRLRITTELLVNGWGYALNQDLSLRITQIRLTDPKTGAPLTGYSYTSGPEPGVMVGGTLWTPEPATFGLAACALFALALWRRRVGC
ncbi:MAG: hypothetical protein NTV70_11735 [Acidobacteria bacterium]|nr:hypothetical protein [Acidobacteriota bacterium]